MTANYQALLTDSQAYRQWLCTLWPYDISKVQHSLILDGVATYGAQSVATPAGSMSWSVWVKPRTTAATKKYLAGFGGADSSVAGDRVLRLAGTAANAVQVLAANDAGTQFQVTSAAGAVPAGASTLVAGVLDLGLLQLRLYIGGVLSGSIAISGTFNSPSSSCSIGRDPVGATNYFDGELSDFQVWSVVLPLVASAGLPSLAPWAWLRGMPQINSYPTINGTTASLAQYWRLNDGGSSTTAANTIGSGSALTLSAPAWNANGAMQWSVLPYYFASHAFSTGPTDAVPNMEYCARITSPPQRKRSMWTSASIGGNSSPDLGQIVFGNGDGGLDSMRTLAMDGRRALVQLGGTLSTGLVLALADYGTVIDAVGAGDILMSPQSATLHLRSKDWNFAKPIQNQPWNTYTPPAVKVSVAGDKIVAPSFPSQTGSLTVSLWLYVTDLITASQTVIGQDDGTNGWAIRFNGSASGSVRFITRGVSPMTLDSPAGMLVAGWNRIDCVYDHSGQAKNILVNGASVATATALTGGLTVASVPLTWLTNSAVGAGTSSSAGTKLSEVSIWNSARSAASIIGNRYLRFVGNESGLVGYWQCYDGQFNYVADLTVNGYTGILYGSTAWDVADWSDPNIAGKALPLCYGEVLEMVPILVDPGNLIYQVHDRQVSLIKAVFDSGAALVPPFSYTGTDVAFNAAANTITATGADFSVFSPGGNAITLSVTVSGAANAGNNATFSVTFVALGPHQTGNVMVVSGPLTTEAAGHSVTIVIKAGTNQYTVDQARGYFTLLQQPAGAITAWARGDAGTTGGVSGYVSTAGGIMRRLAVRHGLLNDSTDIDATAFAAIDAQNAAPVGIGIYDSAASQADPFTSDLPGAGRILRDVIDEVAMTVGASWGFERTGNLLQATVFTGVPVSPTFALDATTIEDKPQWEPQLLSVPYYRVAVAYGQNYAATNTSQSNLAGVVLQNPKRLAYCLNQWRYATAQDATVYTQYAQAQTMVVLANLAFYADALAEAQRLLALFKVRRDCWKVGGHSLPYQADIGQSVSLSYAPAGIARFALPRNFVALEFDEQPSPGSVQVMVWG
jgi:hypothetical protein